MNMLDDRLIGTQFTLTSADNTGTVRLYGIDYHYELLLPAPAGTTVTVVRVSPLKLSVLPATDVLDY
jgi:membrane protein implicated in regulation of membrane protease activity